MKKKLREHRQFRNQLILVSIVCIVLGIWKIPELLGFAFIFGLLGLFNVFTYRANKRDYETLKKFK